MQSDKDEEQPLEIEGHSTKHDDSLMGEHDKKEEEDSLMLGPELLRNQRASICVVGFTTVLVMLFLAVVIFIPKNNKPAASVSSKNDKPLVCESNYTDDTSWESFLERIDQPNASTRCQPGKPECTCSSPLQPSLPPENPRYPDWKSDWQNGFQSNLNLVKNETRKNLDVVLLGDSITERWHGTEFGRPRGGLRDRAETYQRLFNDKDSAVQGLALGIAGDRCPQLLYRIMHGEMDDGLQPHVWWISIGTNDYLGEKCSVDSIVAGNIGIVQEILRQRPTSTVVINSLLPVGNEQGIPGWQDYTDINARLACYAKGRDRVLFFNATDIFVTAQNTVNMTLQPDGLHPSAIGCELWGKAIVEKVQEIEKQQHHLAN